MSIRLTLPLSFNAKSRSNSREFTPGACGDLGEVMVKEVNGFGKIRIMGNSKRESPRRNQFKISELNAPLFRSADIEKWLAGSDYRKIISDIGISETASNDSRDTFFVQVEEEYMKSNYSSEGFRNGDLLLVMPLAKIKYFERMLVKVDQKGFWICYAEKLPSNAINDLYKKSKDKAGTILLKETPLSFITEDKIITGNEKSIAQNIECFRILGMYRDFKAT